MQLEKINIKFANIEKLLEINNGSGTILFCYSFITYGRAINNWFTFIMVIYVGYGSGGCFHPTVQWCALFTGDVLILVIKWITTKSVFICSFVLQSSLQVVIWQKKIADLILVNFGHLMMIWLGVVEDGNE